MRQKAFSASSPGPANDFAEAPQRPLPAHVALIMDGNGRWAEKKGLPRSEGHRAGMKNIRHVLMRFEEHRVKHVTLFAFSTENWLRPAGEVSALMDLLGEALRDETPLLHREGVRIKHIGRPEGLSPVLRTAIRQSIELTKDNDVLTLGVAFNYGGRAEIVEAVRAIVADGLEPSEITEEVFERYLYTTGLPDPDLIIRTAGEMRLSNFLLWQSAYAEYYSTPVLWPDFDEQEISRALTAYRQRQRRWGGVTPD